MVGVDSPSHDLDLAVGNLVIWQVEQSQGLRESDSQHLSHDRGSGCMGGRTPHPGMGGPCISVH